MRKTFNEWTSTVDKDATRLLEIPLMRRSLDRSGTLDLNFDRLLHCIILSYFHFFHSVNYSLFIDIVRKKVILPSLFELKGLQDFCFLLQNSSEIV